MILKWMVSVLSSHGIRFKQLESEEAEKEQSADTWTRSPGMMVNCMVHFGEAGNAQEEEL